MREGSECLLEYNCARALIDIVWYFTSLKIFIEENQIIWLYTVEFIIMIGEIWPGILKNKWINKSGTEEDEWLLSKKG